MLISLLVLTGTACGGNDEGPAVDGATDGTAQSILGTWSGIISQGAESYPMTLVVDATGVKSDYPSLNCGGRLVEERLEGSVRMFTERIEYGLQFCADRVELKMTPTPDNTLQLEFFLPDGSFAARGELTQD